MNGRRSGDTLNTPRSATQLGPHYPRNGDVHKSVFRLKPGPLAADTYDLLQSDGGHVYVCMSSEVLEARHLLSCAPD
jgi:hypothetical protein